MIYDSHVWHSGAFKDSLELLAEGSVEPAIEYRVVAGGGHGHKMTEEKGKIVVGPAVQGGHVSQKVGQVQGQPASTKDHYHCYQHSVCALGSLCLYLVPLDGSSSWPHVFPFSQS